MINRLFEIKATGCLNGLMARFFEIVVTNRTSFAVAELVFLLAIFMRYIPCDGQISNMLFVRFRRIFEPRTYHKHHRYLCFHGDEK